MSLGPSTAQVWNGWTGSWWLTKSWLRRGSSSVVSIQLLQVWVFAHERRSLFLSLYVHPQKLPSPVRKKVQRHLHPHTRKPKQFPSA